MVDITFGEQLEEAKSDDDEIHEDELQIIDSLPSTPGNEEDKEEQSSHAKDTMDQLDDMVKIEPSLTVTQVTHDDMSKNAKVELDESKLDTLMASLIATYKEESKQQPIKRSIEWEDVIEGRTYKNNILMYKSFYCSQFCLFVIDVCKYLL